MWGVARTLGFLALSGTLLSGCSGKAQSVTNGDGDGESSGDGDGDVGDGDVGDGDPGVGDGDGDLGVGDGDGDVGDGDVGDGDVGDGDVGDGDGDGSEGLGSGGSMDGSGSATGGAGGEPTGAGGQIEIAEPIEASLAPEHFGSGTRIKVLADLLEDGPTVFKSFYDSELDAPCMFREVGDSFYCVPEPWHLGISYRGFADAECTQHLVEVEPGCGVSMTPQSVGACQRDVLFEENREVSADVEIYKTNTEGDCLPTGEILPAARARIRAVADMEGLVQGRKKIVPVTGHRLGLLVMESDDGAFGPLGVVDTLHGIECNFDSEVGLCEPRGDASARYREGYSDSDCQNQFGLAFASSPQECGEVKWVAYPDGGDPYFSYHALGPQTSAQFWSVEPGTDGQECVPFTLPMSFSSEQYLYEMAEWPSTALTLTRAWPTNHGMGRLTAYGVSENGDVLWYKSNRFLDSVGKKDCISVSVGGVQVCVPFLRRSTYETRQFADSSCTQKLQYCSTGTCSSNEYYYETASSCENRDRYSAIHLADESVSDPVYELDENGDCVGPVMGNGAWTSKIVAPEDSNLPLIKELVLP